jgi:hypothetical protein
MQTWPNFYCKGLAESEPMEVKRESRTGPVLVGRVLVESSPNPNMRRGDFSPRREI